MVWLQSNLSPLGRETFQEVNVLPKFVREANWQGQTVEIVYICRRETIRCLAGTILQNSGLEFRVSLTPWPLRDKLRIEFHLYKSRQKPQENEYEKYRISKAIEKRKRKKKYEFSQIIINLFFELSRTNWFAYT